MVVRFCDPSPGQAKTCRQLKVQASEKCLSLSLSPFLPQPDKRGEGTNKPTNKTLVKSEEWRPKTQG